MSKYRTSFFIALAALSLNLTAATRRSQQSGNWSNAGTWGGTIPLAGDVVVISSSTIVNLNQSTANALSALTIETGGKLILTVNGSGIHISGNIRNDGELCSWITNSLKGSIFLRGNSYWSGIGTWKLGLINLDTFGFEFDDGIHIAIADNILANTGSSINRTGRRKLAVFVFNGTENASIPSESANYFYPSIVLDKSSPGGSPVTLTFTNSSIENELSILGTISLANNTDRLAIGSMNTLVIHTGIEGNGSISGGVTSGLKVESEEPDLDSVRVTNGTSFLNVFISGSGQTIFHNSFTVRNELSVSSASTLLLPSDATLTLGVNGANPTPGNLNCQGKLLGGLNSGLVFRGNGQSAPELKLSQDSLASYTLGSLEVSRAAGAGALRLAPNSSLVVNGPLQIDAGNSLSIQSARLFLNSTITIHSTAYLTGSDSSSLIIQGSGGNATLRFNQSGSESNRTIRYFELNRTPGRIITIGSSMIMKDELNIVSGKVSSNGNLTLISDASGSAGISKLSDDADLLGEVEVRSWLRGGQGMRGTRMLSAPVNDLSTSKSVYQQLQESVLVTGAGGEVNGFDRGGNNQPFANTIQTYLESAGNVPGQFVPVQSISQRMANSPGAGKGFFLFFRGNRVDPESKLNSNRVPYPVPEDVVLTYKGPINKKLISVPLSFTSNAGDPYNGYHVAGNPYPATIDWSKVSRVNIQDIVSIIKPGGGMVTYSNGITVNGAPSDSGTPGTSSLPLIQTGQGFYVKATAPGASITFTEDCKASGSIPDRFLLKHSSALTMDGSGASGKSTVNPNNHSISTLRIKLDDGVNAEETALVFRNGSSELLDNEDAVYFSGSAVSLSSVSSDGIDLAINFIPEPSKETQIDLNFNVASESQLSLLFKGLNTLHKYIILLEDTYTGKVIQLTEGYQYNFTINRSIIRSYVRNRFKLRVQPEKAGFSELKVQHKGILIYPVPVKNSIHVQITGNTTQKGSLNVYDLKGQKVVSSKELSGDLSLLAKGVYVVEVLNESGKPIGRRKFIKEQSD